VRPKQLPAANARIELARTIAFASGPALAGLLWDGWRAPAFGFAAALSVMAVVLLSGIYEPARTPAPRRHPWQEIREAPPSSCIIRCCGRYSSPVHLQYGLVPDARRVCAYAVRHLGLSATGVGVTLAMFGAGMVIGALLRHG